MKERFLRLAKAFALLTLALLPCACTGETAKTAAYEFTNIRRGTLERTVSASGTIKPVATVRVLPQMSGKVEKVYVDYNDAVMAGDVLAELNTDMLRLKRDQQQAAVRKTRANYELQLANYRSQEALAQRNLISEFEMKTSQTALENLAADLEVAEANLKVIETEINQYAYITSPIDGIVLDRNINVGDTVVDSSSNSSASIFTLAENLREMQIEATVGELEVASIYRGQAVRFTLESMRGRTFSGVVENIRMVPIVSNNIVTYMVIISVENHDGSLFPGMTCAVNFVVEQSENVLMVANAALRYQPSSLSAEQIDEMVFYASLANMTNEQQLAALQAREQTAPRSTGQNTSTGIMSLLTGAGQNNRPTPRPPSGGGSRTAVVFRNLWLMDGDGKLEVIQIRTGISNGQSTEVFLDEEFEGRQVILRERL